MEVLARVRSQQLRLVDAGAPMKVSDRQATRLWRRYRMEGAAGLKHDRAEIAPRLRGEVSASGACYTPMGSLAGLKNGSSIITTWFYDKRLQPCRVANGLPTGRTTMKFYLLGLVLAVSGVLFIRTISAQPSQQSAQQPMDKWEALDQSLKAHPFPYKTIHPKNGFVPDEATAVKIGEAVAVAEYGEKQISQERPFEGRLRGDVWTIMGTLHPQGAAGGTAVIKLSKADGRILFMTHQE